MASKEGYRKCGAKYRDDYQDEWAKGSVTREDLRKDIEAAGGISCLQEEWR